MQGLNLEKLKEDYVDTIFIAGLPLPPTDNQQYKQIIRKSNTSKTGYKSLRVKSDSAVKYKKQFSDWSLVNAGLLFKARKAVSAWVGTIELSFYFAISEERLLTKAKTLKKNDANNRDKNLQDLLAGALRIDDTRFNVTRLEKVVAAPRGEQVVAILKPSKLRTLSEVYDSLDLKEL